MGSAALIAEKISLPFVCVCGRRWGQWGLQFLISYHVKFPLLRCLEAECVAFNGKSSTLLPAALFPSLLLLFHYCCEIYAKGPMEKKSRFFFLTLVLWRNSRIFLLYSGRANFLRALSDTLHSRNNDCVLNQTRENPFWRPPRNRFVGGVWKTIIITTLGLPKNTSRNLDNRAFFIFCDVYDDGK